MKNKAKPEGSMAHGYLREESVGFLNEYLSEYTPTRKRAWDDKEEPAMFDEILEGAKRDRVMSPKFMKLIHGFVLENIEHMAPYTRYDFPSLPGCVCMLGLILMRVRSYPLEQK